MPVRCAVHGSSNTRIPRAECSHPAAYQCKCPLCHEFLGDPYGIPFEYLLPMLRISKAHTGFIRRMNPNNMVNAGKLHLVLDLDHTLLHTVRLDAKAEELVASREDTLAGGRDLFFIDDEYLTKLRPFLREFLQEASTMFEMTLYTMGGRVYGKIMTGQIDPEGSYFSDRVITWEDCTAKGRKSLDIVLAEESNVIIVDDKREVWPDHAANLMVIEPYRYFTAERMMREEEEEEEEEDQALPDRLQRLRIIHWTYFSAEFEVEEMKDVGDSLKAYLGIKFLS